MRSTSTVITMSVWVAVDPDTGISQIFESESLALDLDENAYEEEVEVEVDFDYSPAESPRYYPADRAHPGAPADIQITNARICSGQWKNVEVDASSHAESLADSVDSGEYDDEDSW